MSAQHFEGEAPWWLVAVDALHSSPYMLADGVTKNTSITHITLIKEGLYMIGPVGVCWLITDPTAPLLCHNTGST